jgi:hypothetical protein
MRANPVNQEAIKRVAMSATVVGITGFVTGVGMNMALAKWASSINPYWRSLISAGSGIALGVGFEAFDLRALSAGVAVGGVINGADIAYNYYLATRAHAVAPMIYPTWQMAPAGYAPAGYVPAPQNQQQWAPAPQQQQWAPAQQRQAA